MLSISLKEDCKVRGQESEILVQRPYNKEENREGSRCFDLYWQDGSAYVSQGISKDQDTMVFILLVPLG